MLPESGDASVVGIPSNELGKLSLIGSSNMNACDKVGEIKG